MDYCYSHFDVNNDGKVSMNEAAAVKEIEIYGKQKHCAGMEPTQCQF